MTQIPASELKKRLISMARDVGFDSCRIAACHPPAHATEFREWLRQGAHGEMNYMHRGEEKRCNPEKILPGARSIVALALNYFQGEQSRRPETVATGRIARYALGEDYHHVIEAKLIKIDEFLRSFGGQQKCYVDTGPVLERDHGAQSGIGWHGKSTMLIDQRLGTWFFLAEILTTLELPPDEPVPNRCGTCERCIQACPTGAITGPHQLDARKCISYLTIELKGAIPRELRPLIGDRIFGCDDCLEACPWNRFAQESRESAVLCPPINDRHATARIFGTECRLVPAGYLKIRRSSESSGAAFCATCVSRWAMWATDPISPHSNARQLTRSH